MIWGSSDRFCKCGLKLCFVESDANYDTGRVCKAKKDALTSTAGMKECSEPTKSFSKTGDFGCVVVARLDHK